MAIAESNKYPSKCHGCGKHVDSYAGILERSGRKWSVWCESCYDQLDNSSHEDRVCGNRAYEDQCASACGFAGGYEVSRGDYEGACLARGEYYADPW